MPVDEVERRARLWTEALSGLAEVVEGESMVGGGSLPGNTLQTRLVAVGGKRKGKNTAASLAHWLRCQDPPVVGRVNEDVLFLDPRSVLPEEDDVLLRTLGDAVASLS